MQRTGLLHIESKNCFSPMGDYAICGAYNAED
jgi:hypothetical protein